jgi:threonine synthase
MDRISSFQCRDCGRTYGRPHPLRCPNCGGLLVIRYAPDALRAFDRDALGGAGLWRYWMFLPIDDPRQRVSLGEGGTPLLACPRLGAQIGLPNLWLKYEGANPTGTVKDRSTVTSVSAALERGCTAVGVVTSGNGGSAVSAYAARAGLKSFIFVPASVAEPKLVQMARTATQVVLIEGNYDDVNAVYLETLKQLGGRLFDCAAHDNPYKQQGKKTLAYEVAEQMDWTVPDFFAVPVGVGDIFLAAHLGFEDLLSVGWTSRRPRLIAAQSQAASPVVDAFHSGAARIGSVVAQPTVAEGVAVGQPGARGQWILDVLREQDGLAEAVSDDEVMAAQSLLAAIEGVWAGPTACTALAAVMRLAKTGQLSPAARVVVLISETGLKGTYPVTQRTVSPADPAALAERIAAQLPAEN